MKEISGEQETRRSHLTPPESGNFLPGRFLRMTTVPVEAPPSDILVIMTVIRQQETRANRQLSLGHPRPSLER